MAKTDLSEPDSESTPQGDLEGREPVRKLFGREYDMPLVEMLPESLRNYPAKWPIWKKLLCGAAVGVCLPPIFVLLAFLTGSVSVDDAPEFLEIVISISFFVGCIAIGIIAAFILSLQDILDQMDQWKVAKAFRFIFVLIIVVVVLGLVVWVATI